MTTTTSPRIGVNGLFLAPNGGGVWTYFSHLVPELFRLDQTIAYTLFSSHRIVGHLDLTGADNVRERSFTRSGAVQPARLAAAFARLPLATRGQRLDLLWSPTPFAPLHFGYASVVTLHDLRYVDLAETVNPVERTIHAALARRSVHAAHILTVSEYTRRRIVEVYGVPPERVTVTYEAASPEYFVRAPAGELARVRERYGVRAPYILSAATSHPHKNPELLLDAYAALRRADKTDAQLVLFGAHHIMGERLRAMIRERGLGGEVVLPGYVPDADLPALYQGAAVFVLPSRYEGFGLPVLEAMASEAPVITTRATALPEVAGEAAVLVEADDRGALVEALARVMGDAGLRRELVGRGRERARQFTWRTTAQATLGAFRRVLQER